MKEQRVKGVTCLSIRIPRAFSRCHLGSWKLWPELRGKDRAGDTGLGVVDMRSYLRLWEWIT